MPVDAESNIYLIYKLAQLIYIFFDLLLSYGKIGSFWEVSRIEMQPVKEYLVFTN